MRKPSIIFCLIGKLNANRSETEEQAGKRFVASSHYLSLVPAQIAWPRTPIHGVVAGRPWLNVLMGQAAIGG